VALAALALMLVALGAAGSVARSDPAPSTDLSFNATPDKIVLGSATELKGRLIPKNGDSVSGKRILLEQKVAGTSVWVPVPNVPVAGLLTDADGDFSLSGVKPHNNTQYRARFIQGSQDYTSDAVPVNVKIPITLSKNRIKEGNGIKIKGSVVPGQASGIVRLTLEGNHKRVMKTVNLDDSKFVYEFTPTKVGKFNITAHYRPADQLLNLTNKSITRTLRVR
jgi:hypothetical protein